MMKLKVIFKEVNDSFVNCPTYSGRPSRFTEASINKKEHSMDYRYKDSSSLVLKRAIAEYIHQSSESVELFYKDNDDTGGSFIELNDSDSISKIPPRSQSNNSMNNSTILKTIDDDLVLYYKVIAYSIQVKIDIFQKNIDSVTQTFSLSGTVLNLKHFLMDKFPMDDSMEVPNQKIFSLSLKNKTKQLKIKLIANKEYNDRAKLIDIVKEYEEQKRMLFGFNDSITLKFLLVLNTREAIKMGLNFNFNYFKNLSQMSFEHSAPVHRECSDGLNVFSYCRNTQCSLYNEMFVRCLGYGNFNVIAEATRQRCSKCLCSSLVEARNLGMINAKWEYKGVMNGKKGNGFEGDGITILSNKLYLFSEVRLISTFSKLMIKIKPYKALEDPNGSKEVNMIQVNESCLFDSVPLCFDEKNYEERLQESTLSKVSKNEGIGNLKNGTGKEIHGNSIDVLSSHGNRDHYCLQRCLINRSSDKSCNIV